MLTGLMFVAGLFVGTVFGVFVNHLTHGLVVVMMAKWMNREITKVEQSIDRIGAGAMRGGMPSAGTSMRVGLVMPGKTTDKSKLN